MNLDELLIITSDDSDHVRMTELWALYQGPLTYRGLIKALQKKYGALIKYSRQRHNGTRAYGFAGIQLKSEMKSVCAAETLGGGWSPRQMRWHLKQEMRAVEQMRQADRADRIRARKQRQAKELQQEQERQERDRRRELQAPTK